MINTSMELFEDAKYTLTACYLKYYDNCTINLRLEDLQLDSLQLCQTGHKQLEEVNDGPHDLEGPNETIQ